MYIDINIVVDPITNVIIIIIIIVIIIIIHGKEVDEWKYGCMCECVCSFCLSWVFAAASYANYPGGHALRTLHAKGEAKTRKSLEMQHIETY